MPTKAEWEGMGRKVDMRIDGLTSAEIRKAYDQGFAEGVDWATPRIWNEVLEAARTCVCSEMAQTEAERSVLRHEGGLSWEFEKRLQRIDAAIRKLKKP